MCRSSSLYVYHVYMYTYINHLVQFLHVCEVNSARYCLLSHVHTPVTAITIGTEPIQASLQAGASFEDEAEMTAVAAHVNADEMLSSWPCMHVCM